LEVGAIDDQLQSFNAFDVRAIDLSSQVSSAAHLSCESYLNNIYSIFLLRRLISLNSYPKENTMPSFVVWYVIGTPSYQP